MKSSVCGKKRRQRILDECLRIDKSMKKKLVKSESMRLLVIVFFFVFAELSAQYSISGRLVDEKSNGIESANIRLLESDSVFVSGATSDSNGHFAIKNLKPGSYILAFSHIEYQRMYRGISLLKQNLLLGDISMTLDSRVLDDVQVVADRIIKKKDGMLIFPRKKELQFAGSGYDVLYNIMIPGISVDRNKGAVTRLGQSVALYIDGQKADYREIQNIEAKSIDKIEYIDMPSGKYIQDNTAINIITKKSAGSYFALDAKQNISYLKGDYNATAQFSKGNLSYHLFGGYEMEEYTNVGSTLTEGYHLPDRTVSRKNEVLKDLQKNNSQYVQFNLKSATQKRTLAVKFSLVHTVTPDNQTIKRVSYFNLDAPDIESSALTDEKGYKPTMELYGNFNLPRKQFLAVTLTGSYNKNTYSRDYKEGDFFTLSHVDEDFYNTKLNLNYSKKIHKIHTFSVSLLENYRLSDSQYTGSSAYLQRLYTNEAILRIGYLHNFGKKWLLNTQVGASWLNYKLKGEDGQTQFTPRGNVMLRYMFLPRQTLTFSFNTGNSFPTVNTLNSVDQAINSILTKRGAPDLDMSKLYNGALMYNLFAKKINVQAMLIGNVFTDLAVPYYYAEGDKIISTYRSNIDLRQCIGVLSGTWNVSDGLDFKTELAVLHNRLKGSFNESHTTLRAMADVNYLWKNIQVNLFVKAKEKRLTNSAVFEKDYVNYGGSIRWSITNWHAEIGTTNPFSKKNRMEQTYSSIAYSYDNEMYSKSYQQVGYLKLIYRFSCGKKQKIEKNTIDTSTNSAIMKVK